jgi:hypothetical protein
VICQDGGVENDPFAYEARYGLGGRTGLVIAVALVFAVCGIVLPLSPGMRIADIALFGGGGLLMLGVAASRRVAFRVDATGVTLGGTPPRYRSGTRVVPWTEIERIVLWRQHLPHGASMRYVGLVRRAGAAPLAGPKAHAVAGVTARALTPVSGDILMASRAVTGWRLDEGHLAAAVGHFAPGVPIDR